MLLHSGLVHCRFACKSRKREPYSMIYAFFTAISANSTPMEIAEMTGVKLHKTSYGNPTTASNNYLSQLDGH